MSIRAGRRLRNAAKENREYMYEAKADAGLSMCDYYRGKGTCSMGDCWTEPRCYADEPMTGWPKPWVLKRGARA